MNSNSIDATAEKGTSLWEDAWIKLRKNRLALIGLGLLIFLCVVSLLTPWIAQTIAPFQVSPIQRRGPIRLASGKRKKSIARRGVWFEKPFES